MSESSRSCSVCRRRTLHRSPFSAFSWLMVGVFILMVIGAPMGASAAAFLAIPLALAPPTPIRCQTCGTINARSWGMWFARASVAGIVALLILKTTAARAYVP